MKRQIAKIHYLRIAPRKVRLLGDTLKGLSAQEAEAQLLLRPHRAAVALLKLLRSAVANARNNQKLNSDSLKVANLRVDRGPIVKRFLPRAQGRATPIHKIMSHVTLVLEETAKPTVQRFVINPPAKKAPTPKKGRGPDRSVGKKEMSVKSKEKVGFFKRFFRRKSI